MKTYRMFKIIIVAFSSVALVTTLQWKDCAKRNDSAVTINNFDAPTHINFPGIVHFSLNMTFNRIIESVYVDFDIIRYFLGFPLSLPCKVGTIIGTCGDRNMCYLLNLTLGYSSDHPEYYGYKFQTIMNATLNHTLKCPIEKGNLDIKDQAFELAEIQPYLHLLADGDYTVRVTSKDKPNGPVTGCIEVNVTIGGQDTGPAAVFG